MTGNIFKLIIFSNQDIPPSPAKRFSKVNQPPVIHQQQPQLSEIKKQIEELKVKVDNANVEIISVSEDEMFETMTDSSDDERDKMTPHHSSSKKGMDNHLKQIITREQSKRSHFKSIVKTLKEHKSQQKVVIDRLLEKNHELDLEMNKNKKQLRKTTLKNDLSEEHLKTVKHLKGSLLEDIDSQNSMILDKTSEVNRLTIELNELKVRYRNLENRFEKSRKIVSSPRDTESQTVLELESKVQQLEEKEGNLREKLEMEFRTKENLLKVQYERDCQAKEEAFLKNEEILRSDFNQKLEDKDRGHEEKISRHSNIISDLESKLKQQESSFSNLEQSRSEDERRLKELEATIELKNEEMEKLKEGQSNMETLSSLKSQFSHMADTYEMKIERLEHDNAEIIGNLQGEINQNLELVREKDELIDHLKKDLGNIRSDFQQRMKNNELKNAVEAKNYELQIEDLKDHLKNKEKEIENIKDEYSKDRVNSHLGKRDAETEIQVLKDQIDVMKLDIETKSTEVSNLENANKDLKSHRDINEMELGKQKNLLLDRERDILSLTEDLADRQKTITDLERTIETVSQQRDKQR